MAFAEQRGLLDALPVGSLTAGSRGDEPTVRLV